MYKRHAIYIVGGGESTKCIFRAKNTMCVFVYISSDKCVCACCVRTVCLVFTKHWRRYQAACFKCYRIERDAGESSTTSLDALQGRRTREIGSRKNIPPIGAPPRCALGACARNQVRRLEFQPKPRPGGVLSGRRSGRSAARQTDRSARGHLSSVPGRREQETLGMGGGGGLGN